MHCTLFGEDNKADSSAYGLSTVM